LNSSGSQLIGVRYVQVGLEERENLTVTWNVSIAIRSLCVTLLAAILALVLVVALAEDADARKVRRKKGVADFAQVFHHCEDRYTLQLVAEQCEDTDKRFFAPPDRFSCRPGRPFLIPTRAPYDPPNIQPPKPIDGYVCRAEGSVKMVSIDDGPSGEPIEVTQAATFDLNDVLDRDAPTTERAEEYTIPPGQLASPDLFECRAAEQVQPSEPAPNPTAEQVQPSEPAPNPTGEPTQGASAAPSGEPTAGPSESAQAPSEAPSAPAGTKPLNLPSTTPRTTNDFSCEFAENQQTCVFTMHELVPTNVDEVDDDTGKTEEKDLDRWDLRPHKVDSFNDLFLPIACHPVPLAVPAGADAAGEGSAAWLFGLVLAASGAMVGGVVIARRRFLHDS
jgi:hypothetical protein